MTQNGVVGVLLAAGASSRLGSPKQLLPLGKTTLLGQSVKNANASALERVVVVLGRSSGEIRRSIDFGRAEVVDNTRFGTGCASSLLAGLEAAGDAEALMLLLGDQPGVGPGTIDRVLSAWHAGRPRVAVTSYRDELGHPFVFAKEAFPELKKLHGDKAIWTLLETYPGRVVRVEVDSELPPDIDTPEDYERILARWAPTHGEPLQR